MRQSRWRWTAALLLCHPALTRAEPLHDACQAGRAEEVRQLLLADPAAISSLDSRYGSTPLHWAALAASPDVLELLLRCGAPVEAANQAGQTALHLAAWTGHTAMASRLLAAGADPAAMDLAGRTPAGLSAAQGKPHTAELLRGRTAIAQPRPPPADAPPQALPRLTEPVLEPDGVCRDVVTVPMVFPMLGPDDWKDTFLAQRDGGARRHHGQDLMAERMRPLLACFDGVVYYRRGAAPTLHLVGDCGWEAGYIHINNDNPGTDDDQGGEEYSIPRWLKPGDRVIAGQVVAWCGNSGNAKYAGPHLHFELSRSGGGIYNAAPSLRTAEHLRAARIRLPVPETKPRPGEVRYDGTVRAYEAARAVLVLDLAAVTGAQGRLTPSTGPAKGWIRLGDQPVLLELGSDDNTLSVADLLPGATVVACGVPGGGSIALRAAWVDPGRPAPHPEP